MQMTKVSPAPHLAAAEQAEQVTAERADDDAPHHAPAPPHQATAARAGPPPAEQAKPPPHDDPHQAAAVQAAPLPAEFFPARYYPTLLTFTGHSPYLEQLYFFHPDGALAQVSVNMITTD